ncbi:ImmA/IrrE family metallo-endopeptidase [Streptomyces sp. ISL-112]|uniref:ImmA/IrrE family metallo-endopeptidase n=1 Tax=unclassified Streptomyces TaxID=2593676 RepID=UPI001BEC6CA9|nr:MULTISPECIES: ImmA/IrrE family metallo-endopeptidase [unclassified Streptomyces]MBT2430446.1 ImmA/IrrE family metallo-endopeptidase [Streptomyces sp. ISL-112]MBT2462284.1 ImmA/IrrE family metallo-endopeptidase [Streptomyces sp. ISL-63]
MNWNVAHKVAAMEAVKAHRDLAIDRGGYVDVYSALLRAGLVAMARPIPRLFGMYAAPQDNGPAVLLNASLDIVTQRHTAAHELGHHRAGHGTSVDEELDRPRTWGDGSWRDEEKVAEAFAAWFLMPLPAIQSALAQIGVNRPLVPEHAYRIGRILGTSYAGTVNHLHRLRMLSQVQKTEWLRVKPASIKANLAGSTVPGKAHVYLVDTGAHGTTLRVDTGDLVVLGNTGARFETLPPALQGTEGADGQASLSNAWTSGIAEVTDMFTGSASATAHFPGTTELLEFTLERQAPRTGIQSLWPA